jgi:hypothetical protein
MNFITAVAAAFLALTSGCSAETAIPDPQSCDPGARLFLCRYYTAYIDANGRPHSCYDPTLGRVCVADTAPEDGFAAAQAAYRAEYGSPYPPPFEDGIVDCELSLLYVTPSPGSEACQ